MARKAKKKDEDVVEVCVSEDANQKACFANIPGSQEIADKLAAIHERMGEDGAAADILASMAEVKSDYGLFIHRIYRQASTRALEDAFGVLRKKFKWEMDNETLAFMNRKLQIPIKYIAMLDGTSEQNVGKKIQRYLDKTIPFSNTDGLGEDEKAEMVREALFLRATTGAQDRDSTNAAKAFLELWQKGKERDMVTKWRQIELIVDFLFSDFVPALHREFTDRKIDIDIRSIFHELFMGAEEELRNTLATVTVPEPSKKKPGRKRKKA